MVVRARVPPPNLGHIVGRRNVDFITGNCRFHIIQIPTLPVASRPPIVPKFDRLRDPNNGGSSPARATALFEIRY